jgi:hypothetical protein
MGGLDSHAKLKPQRMQDTKKEELRSHVCSIELIWLALATSL